MRQWNQTETSQDTTSGQLPVDAALVAEFGLSHRFLVGFGGDHL